MMNSSQTEYQKILKAVPGLEEVVKNFHKRIDEPTMLLLMEFLLFGLSEYSLLSRFRIEEGLQFKDMLSSMFTLSDDEDFKEDDSSLYTG